MSFSFGIICGLLIAGDKNKTQEILIYPEGLKTIIFIIPGFFIGYKFTFAYFWNKRAKQLQSEGK